MTESSTTESQGWTEFRKSLYGLAESDIQSRLSGEVESRVFYNWQHQNAGSFEYAPIEMLVRTEAATWCLLHSTEYQDLTAAARSVDTGHHFGELVGGNGWSVLLDLQSFVLRTLDEAVQAAAPGWTIDSAALDKRVNDLAQLFHEERIPYELLILIDPVTLAAPIEVDANTEVVPLGDSDLLVLVRTGLIPATFQPGRGPHVVIGPGGRVAIRRRLSASKTIASAAHNQEFQPAIIAEHTYGDIADAIAVTVGLRPRQVGWLYQGTNPSLPTGCTWRQLRAPTKNEQRLIEISNSTHVTEVYSRISAGLSDSVRLAIRRIGQAVSRRLAADRLTDSYTAAEALFADLGTHSKAGSIAARASAIWPAIDAKVPALEIKTTLEVGYRLRNAIVHGDEKSAQAVLASSPIAFADISDLVSRVLDILRKIVIHQLHRAQVPSTPWR